MISAYREWDNERKSCIRTGTQDLRSAYTQLVSIGIRDQGLPLMQVLHYWSKIGISYSTDPNLGPVTLSNQFCINPRVIHLTSRASMNPAQLKQQRYGAAEKKGAAYSRYGCTALGGRGVQSRA